MTDTEIVNERDSRGRFVTGNIGGGRKPGSRGKLGEQFVSDLRDAWLEYGVEALRECAKSEPAAFCKIIASLLPRDVSLTVDVVDPAQFASKFRHAIELLGNDPAHAKVINGRHR
jgi:hypothetical protein